MNIHVPEIPVTWTEERTDALKVAFVEGLSASKIAERLGYVTRNAVIGKIHRLGLNLDHLLTADEKADRLARKKEAANIRKQRSRERERSESPERSRRSTLYQMFRAKPTVDEQEWRAENSRNIALLDLQDNDCREGYGEQAPYLFCGNPKFKYQNSIGVEVTSSYCKHHHLRNWTPASGNSPYAKRPTISVWA